MPEFKKYLSLLEERYMIFYDNLEIADKYGFVTLHYDQCFINGKGLK